MPAKMRAEERMTMEADDVKVFLLPSGRSPFNIQMMPPPPSIKQGIHTKLGSTDYTQEG